MIISCPNRGCKNYEVTAKDWPNRLYEKYGTSAAGGQRYRCRACGKTFMPNSYNLTKSRQSPNENIVIVRRLFSGYSLRDIALTVGLSPAGLTKRLDFINNAFSQFESNAVKEIRVEKFEGTVIMPKNTIKLEYHVDSLYIFQISTHRNQNNNVRHGSSDGNASLKCISTDMLNRLTIINRDRQNYSPKTKENILNAYRIWHNFVWRRGKELSPAMKLGISGTGVTVRQMLGLAL